MTANSSSGRLALYAGVGERLDHYDVDVAAAALTKRESVTLPGLVQYGWPDPASRFFYLASSTRGSGPPVPGEVNHLSAYEIDAASGALRLHGRPVALPSRPVHLSLDIPAEHALLAYNDPSGLNVYRINPDGTVGAEVTQPVPPDTGILGHQIRVLPSNQAAILVTRGNDAAPEKPEDPGALKVFGYRDGVLTNQASLAPGEGYGFGPRHVDFHPTQPWVFVSVERQNQLFVYRMRGDALDPEPLFIRNNLADPGTVRPRQMVSAVHVHPNGRHVYVANRAGGLSDFAGTPVFAGGENSIAVYAIDQGTGDPTLIQHIATHGFFPRTFTLDPSGRMLVAANQHPHPVRDGTRITTVPASMVTYRIGNDGKLEFVHKYEIETGGKNLFWIGIVRLP